MKSPKEDKLEEIIKIKGLKVSSAYLQTALSWPGHPAERTITQAKFRGIQMHFIPHGLILDDGETPQLLVPGPNVACCILSQRLEII